MYKIIIIKKDLQVWDDTCKALVDRGPYKFCAYAISSLSFHKDKVSEKEKEFIVIPCFNLSI